ncbi:MAG: glycosyltransferase family 39 protein [Pseudomonadota bacterium]
MAVKKTKRAAAGRKTAPGKKPGATKRRAARAKPPERPWGLWTLVALLAVAVLRLGINALDLVPVHFDEGQYWAYGQELAAGHFSKPPLVGWIIYATTLVGGDTTFALRIGAVAAHALTAWFIYLAAASLWDGRTGFWAALGFTAAPGVTVSAMIMTTDPVMMVGWAIALYAWAKAAAAKDWPTARPWWILLGAAIGLGMLAKYTALAFAAGAIGYGLFSARSRDWRGTALAVVAGLVVFSPNLAWQVANDWPTVGHVAEDAVPPGERYNFGKLAEFLGAQLGVIGPVWFLGMVLALLAMRRAEADWRLRMIGWQTGALLVAMAALAFWTRAQPNWAAPAYVAGSILAARWFLTRSARWALPAQTGIGAVAALALYGAAWAYAAYPGDLPRGPDPFKKMRLSEPFCAPALAAMAEEGAEVLLSDDRRRLSECMFQGSLTFQDIAIWNDDVWPENHHEMVATLQPEDHRPMIWAVLLPEAADYITQRFESAREIETGRFETHAGRTFGYSIWLVEGFKDY